MNKLLLISHDELLILWDALNMHRFTMTPGDPEFEDTKNLFNRVGELMSNSVDRMGNPKLK